MYTPNIPLLRETMDAILAYPELHIQDQWATQTPCGTAYCFAGWACKLSGIEANEADLNFCGSTECTDTGESISVVAQKLLDLDSYTANVLFAANNTTADLKHMVDEIAEKRRLDHGPPTLRYSNGVLRVVVP